MAFPGVPDIRIAPTVEGDFDAAIIMECGDLARTGVDGPRAVLRHQHRPSPGQHRLRADQLVRRDARPPAREMVFDLIARARRAAVDARSRRTSTSRSSPTPARSTTRASRRGRSTSAAQTLEAGVDPVLVARNVYDSNNMGRLKLFGAVLSAMQIDATGRIAIVYLDHEMARAAGGTYDDTEGLDQPAADGQGDPGGRLLQADRGRRVPRQHAVEGRRRHRRGREGVRRRRPQERRRLHRAPARIDALQDDVRREDRTAIDCGRPS